MEYEIEDNESVSTAVIRAVSAIDGRKPESLPLLTGVLNPDALDTLFETRPDGDPRTGGHLAFIYNQCRVTVDNGEYLTIQPLESHPQNTGERNCNTDLQ